MINHGLRDPIPLVHRADGIGNEFYGRVRSLAITRSCTLYDNLKVLDILYRLVRTAGTFLTQRR